MINHISHPPFCPHEMDVLGYVKQSIASAYTSLLSRIDSHIEDDRVHVTCEEKDKWDNKVDKTQFRELELRMTEKADFNELTELKEQLSILKVAVDNKIDSDTAKSVVTETEFDELANTVSSLNSKVNLLNQTINDTFDTSEFATTQWVQDQHYIKTADLKTSVIDLLNNSREVKDTLQEVITNVVTSSDSFIETVVERVQTVVDNGTVSDSIRNYVEQTYLPKGAVLGTINGQTFTQGGAITIDVTGDGTGFTEQEVRNIINSQLQNNDAKTIIKNIATEALDSVEAKIKIESTVVEKLATSDDLKNAINELLQQLEINGGLSAEVRNGVLIIK